MDASIITIIGSGAGIIVTMISAFWYQNHAQSKRHCHCALVTDQSKQFKKFSEGIAELRKLFGIMQKDIAELQEGYEKIGEIHIDVVSMQKDISTIQEDVSELKEGYKQQIGEIRLDIAKLEVGYKEIKVIVADTNARLSHIEEKTLTKPRLGSLLEDDRSSSPALQGTTVPASPVQASTA